MDRKTFLRNICLFAIFFVTAGMIAVTPVFAQPTVADASPNQVVEINESIIFDGSGSQGNIIEYIWDVGDGNTGSGLNPQHIYTKTGSYIVSLTIINGEGNTNTDWATVTVENTVPPTTPSNFAATGGDGFVSLTWNENTEADVEGYNIYRCTDSGGSYLKINDKLVTITGYNDTAVINDTTFYYYVITAVDTSLLESEYSSEKEAIPSSSEPTFVGGTISSDTTWNLQGSPYIITADIRIESGVSLIVEPGTNVGFAGNYKLQVDGKLTATGTEASPISFTPFKIEPVNGDWQGIYFTDTSNDDLCIISHAIIEYANRGISCEKASPQISNNTIRYNHCGIYLKNNASPSITGSVITENSGYGLQMEGSGNSGDNPAPIINYNMIFNNESYEIHAYRFYNPSETIIDATNNWWGTIEPTEIESQLYDYSDNPSNSPIIDYEPFLTESPFFIISYLQDSPDAFSPNGDGNSDSATISYLISRDAAVTVKIYDAADTLVRTLKDQAQESAGANTLIWDGKDDSGALMAEGTYTYTIDAVDGDGVSAPQVGGSVSIDNHFMRITEPDAGSVLAGDAALRAVPSEYIHNVSSVYFYYRPVGTSSWTSLGNSNEQADESWTDNWDTTNVGNGEYELRVWGYHYDLNNYDRHEYSFPFQTVYISNAVGYFMDRTLFSPNGDGIKDTATLYANLGQPADWTLTFKDATENIVRTFQGTDEGIIQPWDGKNSSDIVVPDDYYTFEFSAVAQGTSTVLLDDEEEIEVDNTPPTAIITQPVTDSEIGDTVKVYGITDDLNFDSSNSFLFIGQGTEPSSWSKLKDITSPKKTESLFTSWDTTSWPNGNYVLKLTIFDLAGNVAKALVDVIIYNVIFNDFNPLPAYFSPDGDGTGDEVLFSAVLSMPLAWTITIKDQDQTLVRTFSGFDDFINQSWDGTDEYGVLVPEGIYTYTVGAMDPDTGKTAQSETGSVTVDIGLPFAQVTLPAPDNIISGNVSIQGTARDSNFDTYTLEYGTGMSPDIWTHIHQSSVPVEDGELATWDILKINNGIYTLRLSVTDVAGRQGSDAVTVTIDNIIISDVSTQPTFFNPAAGETTTLSFTLDRPAVVSIDLYKSYVTIGGAANATYHRTFIMRLAEDIPFAGGVNSYSWDGKDDMGDIIEHGAYTYVISAHDDEERVGLFNPEYIPGSVSITDPSVTPENYDPFRNDPIYINYTLAAPAWVTIGGQYPADFPGFVLEGVPMDAGPQTEIWNARDGFGTILQEDFTLSMKTAILPDVFSVVQDDTLSIDTLLVDSYRLLPAYNEISTIYYSISRMADVTIKMVSPNGDKWIVAEFTGLEAGDHALEWDGTDALDRQVSVEGNYRLELTATDPIANTTRMRTANITVYK